MHIATKIEEVSTPNHIGSPLKWPGGKSRLLPQFQRFLPRSLEGRGYVEPFMGGASVGLHVAQTRNPRSCTLLDVNPDLVNVFIQIRDRVDELILMLAEHRARHNDPSLSVEQRNAHYYRVRGEEPPEGSVAAAARFIYLNKTCFNGLFRVNSKGRFNVPAGDYENPTIFDADQLHATSHLLRDVNLVVSCFRDVERFVQDGDFLYCDPPYVPVSKTSSFTGYTKNGFTEGDQTALRDLLERISPRCQWMLSNSATTLIQQLYTRPGMYQYEVWANRSVNSKATGRGKIAELVVTNFKVP